MTCPRAYGDTIKVTGVGAGVLAPSWLPIMGVAVAARFIVGSVVMRWEDRILPVLLRSIPEVPEERLMPDERAVVVRHCDALVLGMGRVGEGGVYRRLSEDFGKRVYSVEFDEGRIEELRRRGKKITSGDVTDPKLWRRIELDCEPQLFVLALPGHREGMALIEAIRRHHPRAVIASTTLTEVDRGGCPYLDCQPLRGGFLDLVS